MILLCKESVIAVVDVLLLLHEIIRHAAPITASNRDILLFIIKFLYN